MYSSLDFSHERGLTQDEMIRRIKVYYPDADFILFRKAYLFAKESHLGQLRSSGEEYFVHPLNVAAILIKLRFDIDSIIAGLLHDVIEDCGVSYEELKEKFNETVADLVIGLTKISKIKFKTKEETQAENFRKMVVAMAKDIRVIIIKLADRMHNMRTLQYVSEEKQRKIAQETLDIYVPLASRLGINSVKGELEDLCLRFLKPEFYYKLAEKVAMKKSERDHYIKDVMNVLRDKLLEYSLKVEVKGRPKHFYSIYKKMMARGVDFDQIQDILAFRIMVNNITECYKALGIVHSSYTPIPGRFKDYIAIPKVNNYQSLHTTVIGPKAERIEIQIRTHEMDDVAETGIAAHWKYKEGLRSVNTKLEWVDELLEVNEDVKNNTEFMEVIKNDIDIGGVFVFTPTGDVCELKHGATPLDFAYAVHTEVGHHCIGAKVNGKMVPLRYVLKSGDSVEILTSKVQTPSKDWLKIVKSSRAKSKIRQWLLKIERDKNKVIGKEIVEKGLRKYNTSIKSLKKNNEANLMFDSFHVANEDEFYIHVGSGKIDIQYIYEAIPAIAKQLDVAPETESKTSKIKSFSKKVSKSALSKSNKENAVIVDGMDDMMVRMARCCNPIPGDPITGYITRGRGITVHVASCQRIDSGEFGRIIEVEWNPEFAFKHPVNIRVITHDRPGILSLISKTINGLDVNIKSALAKSLPDRKGSFLFEIEVNDYSELLKTINSVESLEEVIAVDRGKA